MISKSIGGFNIPKGFDFQRPLMKSTNQIHFILTVIVTPTLIQFETVLYLYYDMNVIQ